MLVGQTLGGGAILDACGAKGGADGTDREPAILARVEHRQRERMRDSSKAPGNAEWFFVIVCGVAHWLS
jgi:hypothetical protein